MLIYSIPSVNFFYFQETQNHEKPNQNARLISLKYFQYIDLTVFF